MSLTLPHRTQPIVQFGGPPHLASILSSSGVNPILQAIWCVGNCVHAPLHNKKVHPSPHSDVSLINPGTLLSESIGVGPARLLKIKHLIFLLSYMPHQATSDAFDLSAFPPCSVFTATD